MVSIKRFIIRLVAALHTCIEISLAESKNPKNACRADKIVKLTNYREIICVYQCLFQKYLRLADSSQIYVARSPMVSIKRFIIRLVAALHTCIEISLAESKNPKNACRADKIVKLTNYREIICVYQCLFQKYLRLADSSQIYVARSPMVGIKRFIIRLAAALHTCIEIGLE
jgi:ribosomal protein S12